MTSPLAPTVDQLPRKRADGKAELELDLQVVTPIFGGGPVTRLPDSVDVIRTAGIRGHLRFWWRALHASPGVNCEDLYQREMSLWGGPTGSGGFGRSPVELRVDIIARKCPQAAKLDYALFSARGSDGQPPANVRQAGVRFRLRLRVPIALERQVVDALRAWILFGGYGGRTRRGLGSLTTIDDHASWLPQRPTLEALNAVFGRDIVRTSSSGGDDIPRLAGARIFAGSERTDAEDAWRVAVGWLSDFRQGSQSFEGARQPGKDKRRPSISNWPEADKVRQLSRAKRGLPWAHPPRHNDVPAWPRAGFGLPIVGQFQKKSRREVPWERDSPPRTEPDDFQILWQSPDGICRNRLASPLIVKPLALANGKHSPIALWLNRGFPRGVVVLTRNNVVVCKSGAPFDRLVAEGDDIFFSALDGYTTLEGAFFAWLLRQHGPAGHRGSNNQARRRNQRR